MPNHRKDAFAQELYAVYQAGFSIEDVAREFGKSRQAVHEMFKRRGFEMRPRPSALPFIEFNDEKYTLRVNGYYGKTHGNRAYLHRDVWEYHHRRAIPAGYDIHHRDENKSNNKISNLELITSADHSRLYGKRRNQYTKQGCVCA